MSIQNLMAVAVLCLTQFIYGTCMTKHALKCTGGHISDLILRGQQKSGNRQSEVLNIL